MTAVGLDLLLSLPRPFSLSRFVARVSDPADLLHGRYLSPTQLVHHHALGSAARQPLLRWLGEHGLSPVAPDEPWRLTVHAERSCLVEAFGPEATAAFGPRDPSRAGLPFTSALPPALRGLVARVDVHRHPPQPWVRRRLAPGVVRTRRPTMPRALTPPWLRRALEVPAGLDGRGEHVMLMALGGEPRPDDLGAFAGAFGHRPAPVHLVECGRVSPAARCDPMARHETTMLTQWLLAMVPAARVTLVLIDPAHVADPWATFYEAVLAETLHPATVAVTSWSSPERQHYRVHGREVSTLRLAQLAAIGCSMVAATGDWGPVEGFPAAAYQGARVCGLPWPGITYPACEPGVLAVGGTVGLGRSARCLRSRLSDALAQALPVAEIASSGGFSEAIPVPDWQARHLAPAYPRTHGRPAVVPLGRGVPDVAMPAWGTPATTTDNPGYGAWGRVDGRWRPDIGGTSLGAVLWGAVLALANQALRQHGDPRVGWVNPRLYRLVQEHGASVFHSIERGSTAMTVPAVGPEGRVTSATIPGYRATRGWDPTTGLGLPRVGPLLAALRRSRTVGLGQLAGPCIEGGGAFAVQLGLARQSVDVPPQLLQPPPQPAAHRASGQPQRDLEVAAPDVLEVVQLERDLQVEGQVPQGP